MNIFQILIGFFGTLLGLGFGVIMLFGSYNRYQKWKVMDRGKLPLSSAKGGYISFEGSVKSIYNKTEGVSGALSDDTGLFRILIKERFQSGDGTSWVHSETYIDGGPFLVEDSTGSLYIDSESFTSTATEYDFTSITGRIDDSESLKRKVKNFENLPNEITSMGRLPKIIRFKEVIIKENDVVSGLGKIVGNEKQAGQYKLAGDKTIATITNQPYSELKEDYSLSSAVFIFILGIFGVGFGFLWSIIFFWSSLSRLLLFF